METMLYYKMSLRSGQLRDTYLPTKQPSKYEDSATRMFNVLAL
jgi:hypothetical protein